MELPPIIKKHPVLTTVGVLGGGILLYTLVNAGGGGGGTTVVQSGPDPALAAAQLQADAAAQHDNAQIQINRDNLATQLALAQEQGSDAITAAQIAADTQLGLAGVSSQLQKYALDVQQDIGRATIEASTRQLEISTAGQVDLSQIQSNTYLGLSHDQTLATIAGWEAQRDVSIAGFNSQVAIAKTQAKSSKTSGLLGLAGSIIGAFL